MYNYFAFIFSWKIHFQPRHTILRALQVSTNYEFTSDFTSQLLFCDHYGDLSVLLISIDIFYDYANRQINSIFALTRDLLFYLPIPINIPEQLFRYRKIIMKFFPLEIYIHF